MGRIQAIQCRADRQAIGLAVDNTGCAYPSFLAISDVDRADLEARRFSETAGGISNHSIYETQCREVSDLTEGCESHAALGMRGNITVNHVDNHSPISICVRFSENNVGIIQPVENRKQIGKLLACGAFFEGHRMEGDQQVSPSK